MVIFSSLWALEFLILWYDRKFYTSFEDQLVGPLAVVRVCAALAQFVDLPQLTSHDSHSFRSYGIF